ncbi:MAG: LUD domain-containing protein [Bacteroidetes bacterium]|nr:LUD domain-containing protein [Bacteroidota bacterium]MBS1739341.1 LUD domain-containing protein [Bacteroidota bacterium]
MQTLKTSAAREKILGKIRNGLSTAKLPMPFPEVERNDADVYAATHLSADELFAEEFIKLGGKFVFCANEQELLDSIHSLADSRGWKQVLCAEKKLLSLFQNNKLSFIEPSNQANESADACITICEALVARTGSVILSSKQHDGRTAPVFYPVHIIIAYQQQLVNDIRDSIHFIKKKYGTELPSMINLNTGPSRTADIEKTLVVGVHGPGEVFCFYVHV